MARQTLRELNIGFAREGSTEDFDTLTEYRVGKWGVQQSRDGYSSRGVGGDKLHLSVVTVITRIQPDYNWRTYCLESVHISRWATADQAHQVRERQLRDHGQPWHYCRQPRVGDVIAVRPVCRFENVRGTAAWTPEEVDTDSIDCINCRKGFFHEVVDGVEERRLERAGVEARKAAKPLPARCFWCGDIRPQTKATKAGEQLPCSVCKEQFEILYWVETTGCYCQYHAESYREDPRQHLLDLGLEEENKAYDILERREGRYFR